MEFYISDCYRSIVLLLGICVKFHYIGIDLKGGHKNHIHGGRVHL
jgi:hypothetical protein